jgi:hypothetical protein
VVRSSAASDVYKRQLRNLDRLYVVPDWKYQLFAALWTKLPAWLRLWAQLRRGR